jgi:hypothetical protein
MAMFRQHAVILYFMPSSIDKLQVEKKASRAAGFRGLTTAN